jgi:hypothetical protein
MDVLDSFSPNAYKISIIYHYYHSKCYATHLNLVHIVCMQGYHDILCIVFITRSINNKN